MKIKVPVRIKPYTREQFDALVTRGEKRLGLQFFFSPPVIDKIVKIEKLAQAIVHNTDCHCTVCFNRELDRILANAEKSTQELQTSLVE